YRRPVLAAGLPAVDVKDAQDVAGQLRSRLPQGFAKPLIELQACRLRVKLIAFQPFARSADIIGMAGGSVADSQEGPLPFRSFPAQAPSFINLIAQVEELVRP